MNTSEVIEQQKIKPTLFENGLPIRPIIKPLFETIPQKDKPKAQITIFLLKEEVQLLGNLSIDFVAHSNEAREIWVAINNHYVVFENVPIQLIENASKNQIEFNVVQLKENTYNS